MLACFDRSRDEACETLEKPTFGRSSSYGDGGKPFNIVSSKFRTSQLGIPSGILIPRPRVPNCGGDTALPGNYVCGEILLQCE